MTEAPIEWHPDADFFRVVCRLGALLPDGSDADTKPDLTTKAGTVTISSTAPGRILVKTEADGHDRIIGYSGDTYDVAAATGELIAADGTVGLQLLSPTSDRVKPQGYPYTATIKLGTGGPSVSVTFDATPTHPDGTVDLARLAVEPIMDGATPTTVAQQLAAMQAQIDNFGAIDPALIAAEVEDYLTANPIDADPAGTAASAVTAHEAAADPHPQYLTAGEVPAPDLSGYVTTTDPRLSDSRTPTAHTHDDRYFTEAEVATALAGKANTSHTHAPADITGTAVVTTDPRLSDARTPTAHKATHATGGTDALTPASIGAAAASHTHGAADLSGVVKTVNGTSPDGAGNVAVAGGGGGVGDVQFTVARAGASVSIGRDDFNTYPLDGTPTVNIGGGTWDAATYVYTVPTTGLYLCVGAVRMADNATGRSIAVGIGTVNGDAPHVHWADTGGKRPGRQYVRLARFNAGDGVRMYIYSDGAVFPTQYNPALSEASGQSMQLIKLAD